MTVTIHMENGTTFEFEQGGYYKVSPPYIVIKKSSRGRTLGHVAMDNVNCIYKDDAEVTIDGNSNVRR